MEETEKTPTPKDESKAHPQTLWIRPGMWEALCVVKEDVQGTWSRVMGIFIEKMVSSGLMTEEAILKVKAIVEREELALGPDSEWNTTFRTPESWPMAGDHIKTIAEESAKLGPLLEDLVEVVEEHAIAMVDIADSKEEDEDQ
jgi:hypothetical protein